MRFKQVFFHSFGYELPPRVVTSSELEKRLEPVYSRLKLPEGRLELMSGIQERRFWNPGTRPSDGAAQAGEKALAASGISRDRIECLIFTGVSRDMMEPASASFVHHALGLSEKCLIFDLSNACLGFLNGMIVLGNMIELGQVTNGLIVSSETAEDLVDTTIHALNADTSLTRKTIKASFASLTIGSAAVSLVMGNDGGSSPYRLAGGAYRANTSQCHLCKGGKDYQGTLMLTDSEELLKQGVETARATWGEFQEELGWSEDSIDRYFCHQVGTAHSRLLFDTLKLQSEKNFETLHFLGNVGSVSAPITMAIGIEQGQFLPGRKAALLGIGSGINCLMIGVESCRPG
ncbi:3-oxoacyl-ACP synthase III [Thermodesulfobacteriota bacterium]